MHLSGAASGKHYLRKSSIQMSNSLDSVFAGLAPRMSQSPALCKTANRQEARGQCAGRPEQAGAASSPAGPPGSEAAPGNQEVANKPR